MNLTIEELQFAKDTVDQNYKISGKTIWVKITDFLDEVSTILFKDGVMVSLKWYNIGKLIKLAAAVIRFIKSL